MRVHGSGGLSPFRMGISTRHGLDMLVCTVGRWREGLDRRGDTSLTGKTLPLGWCVVRKEHSFVGHP